MHDTIVTAKLVSDIEVVKYYDRIWIYQGCLDDFSDFSKSYLLHVNLWMVRVGQMSIMEPQEPMKHGFCVETNQETAIKPSTKNL